MLVFGINLLQAHLLNISYLSDRTALIYYVLFVFLLLFAIRDMYERLFLGKIIALAVSIFFVITFVRAVNLRYVYEWSYDAYTYDVYAYMDKYRNEHPELKTMEVNSSWLFYPSLSYYTSTGRMPWLHAVYTHTNVDTVSTSLFYYATIDDAAQLKNYRVVREFEAATHLPPRQVLMIHK